MSSDWKGTTYPVDIVGVVGGPLDVNITNQPISIDDNGASITVDGAVSVNNFPANQDVTITGQPITVSQGGVPSSVTIADGANLDAFSRVRVSNPEVLFQAQFQYDLNDVTIESVISGTGIAATLNANTRLARLACGVGVGTSIMQSFEYIPYQPGRSQFIATTFVFGITNANTNKRIGYFDDENGIFFESTSTTNSFVRRSSTSGAIVNDIITQTNWNIDKLDGTGSSGITLDLTKAQIFVIDLQFLGMGRVRVGFDIDGIIYYCHYFQNANNLNVPYMQTASLPVRIELENTAGATASTLDWKCVTVFSEGGVSFLPSFIGSTIEATATANGSRQSLWSIRPSLLFGGFVNRTNIVSVEVSILNAGTNEVFWELVIGAAFSAAPVFTQVNSRSGAEFGPNGTFSNLTNGLVMKSGYVAATNQLKETVEQKAIFTYPLTLDAAGAHRALGTITLLVTAPLGNSAVRASCNFIEIR